MTFSDEDLMAYADGELDDAKSRQIQDAINRDPEIARRVASHRALRDSLLITAARPRPRESKSNVVPLRGHRSPVRPRPRWIALAASFVLGALALQFGMSLRKSDSIVEHNGQMLASGALQQALSSQLAGPRTTQTAVQIGVSFLSKGGEYCRTFQLQETSGLACNESGHWQLPVLAHTEPTSPAAYRPAGSNLPPAVIQAVNDTIAGGPLDAKSEAAARAQKWQHVN